MTENTELLLLCPTCKKSVKEHHKDDIQTWYCCEAGHQTANPIKQELDGIQIFQRKICKDMEEHPEHWDNYKPLKLYPSYAAFCDDPEEQTGFKPARVARWLAENEHFKTDRETDILYYGDEAKGTWIQDGET